MLWGAFFLNKMQYVHALKARGLKVKIIVFPEDAHPIDR